MASISVEDITTALGRASSPSDIELSQWDMWISDALMLIGARLGDLGALDQDRLAYVVREAVVSHIRRPDDATSVDVRVDDGQVSKTYRSSAGRITIRDEWWNLLSPTGSAGTAFSIRPTGGYVEHLPWCTLMMAGTYCSCGADIAGAPIYEGADW